MPRQSLTPREIKVLRVALEQGVSPSVQEDTARALQALAPHINSAALRLAERWEERRAVCSQAWGLAGGMVMFVAVAWLMYQNWAFFLAEPMRWGLLVGFGVITFLVVGCLPIILRREEGVT